MNNTKTTKRALLSSVIAMIICVAMLIGTTFAWFTDSASTAVNKIQAGTLDVQLLMYDGTDYVDISNDSRAIFGTGSIAQNNNAQTLWEPGKTQVAYLAIKNNGNLALKYKVALDVDNVSKNLYEVMEYAITPDATNTNPVTAWTSGNSVVEGTQVVATDVSLPVGATHKFALSVHMKEEAGNDYQGGMVNFDLTVLATQDTVENDSNGNTYDENAEYAVSAATAAELAVALASGIDVVLTAPIQMPEVIEVKGDVTIYGGENGQLLVPDNADRVINITDNTEPVTLTLSNVDVVGPTTGTYTRGVSVYATRNVTIVADNSSISANYYALNIASANENVKAVIKNTTITGWCAFQTWSAGTKATFDNCTLIGNNDKTYNADGWNDFATVIINENTTNVDLTFKNCRIEANQTTGNKQYLISIRARGAKVNMDGCTFIADGAEIATGELKNYIDVYSPQAVDFNMRIDGRVLTANDVFIDE